MHNFESMTFLLIYGLCLLAVNVRACPYEECDCDASEIDCSERELTSIPIIHNVEETGYRTLLLDANEISEIPTGSLPIGLVEISINENPITIIENNAFNDLSTNLETLYFSHANFTRIPDAFRTLLALELLSIKDTKIMDWNIGVITHIGHTLRCLILENVGITSWPDWLQNLSHLNELNIASSNLSSIPYNAFDKFAGSLLILTLNNDNFTAVPKALFILKKVRSLDLHDNKIYSITWLPNSSKLTDLDLSNNNISDAENISSVLRRYENSLVSLTLSLNKFSSVPDLSFLAMLQSLDLSHNEITDVCCDCVPGSVDDLNLSYNLLLLIPTTFRNLTFLSHMCLPHNTIQELEGSNIPPWITNLDLANNLITELTYSTFSNDSGLQALILDNNPIVTISKWAFKNLNSLMSLSLQNTKLTRLPMSLTYLTNLRSVDMSNNPDLVCTCLEKSLQPTIMSDIHVSGNCGSISIYNFFATLDLTCP